MKRDNIGDFYVEKFPVSRIATTDIGAKGLKKHHIKALIELDVTRARELIKERRKVQKISFNSWLIKCISTAIEEFRPIHGVKKGKQKVVIFDDIDVSIAVERTIDGKKVPLPYVIRQCNKKSISDINDEINSARAETVDNEGDFILGRPENSKLKMILYYSLPAVVRRLIWDVIIGSPRLTKKSMGTVMVTSVGMMGRINGWIMPVSVHPLCFALGSVVKKPGVYRERIEIREYLFMTVYVDHNAVDGAPAARALSHLTKLVESGYGLN